MARAKPGKGNRKSSFLCAVSALIVVGSGFKNVFCAVTLTGRRCSLYKESGRLFAEISVGKLAFFISCSEYGADFAKWTRLSGLMLFDRIVYFAFSAIVDTALQEAGHVQTRV
ncbi:MAG: hypothetical protein CMJ47_13120 [Planctomyces sp.]|nr:hypothetical protein [Planctomyces sp.]